MLSPRWDDRAAGFFHGAFTGGAKQQNDFPLRNKFYFYANIFYCFVPPTWPPWQTLY